MRSLIYTLIAIGSIVTAMPTQPPSKCTDGTICLESGKCAGNKDACTPPPPEYDPVLAKDAPKKINPNCPPPDKMPSCSLPECGSAIVQPGKEITGETGVCGFTTFADLEGCLCTVHATYLSHEPRPKGTR